MLTENFYNFNPDFCPDLTQITLPLYLPFPAVIGKKYSVTYNKKLMTIMVCSIQPNGNHQILNWVKVMEYPAKKVIKVNT